MANWSLAEEAANIGTTGESYLDDLTARPTEAEPDVGGYNTFWMDPGELPMNAVEDKIYEYACHEGNYALPGILAGARQQELDEAQ